MVRQHQHALYDILLRAAAQSLIQLAADPHAVGGLMGVLCVLHTWTRALGSHPHVHCLVPAGGVSADRTEWRTARPTYLVPVQALSQLFRGRFCALVRQECPDLTIPASVWSTEWVVYGQPSVQGTERVLRYLGRYVYRIALTNNRILSIEAGQVSFRYQDSQTHRWKTMTLPAQECIRRFLQHVLPQGFHKVRDSGLWSPAHRALLHRVQLALAGPVPPLSSEPPPPPPAPGSLPAAYGSALLLRPSLGQCPWQTAAPLPRWPRLLPTTLAFMSLPTSEARGPSVDTPTNLLLKWARLD